MIQNVSIIGAGTMGNGIAHVFAQNACKVNLVDISQTQLDKGLATIQKNLDRQVSKALITEEQKLTTLQNILTLTSLTAGVQQADLVIEATTENEALKLKIFKQMDEAAPEHCILASNTSSILIPKQFAATIFESKGQGAYF